jgi:hypothetical protein
VSILDLLAASSAEEETSLEELAQFFGRKASQATQQSRKPWHVEQVILVNKSLWISAQRLGLRFDTSEEMSRNESFKPLARLWQPDPMVSELLWPLLRHTLQQVKFSGNPLEIWDLGSGAGRDVAFLAEQIKANGISDSWPTFGHRSVGLSKYFPYLSVLNRCGRNSAFHLL